MKTIKKVPVKYEFTKGKDPLPNYDDMVECVIYVSEHHGISEHKCLCGCGEIAIIGLKPKWNGWNLIKNNEEVYSIEPSILNTNCPNKSHYIITKNVANFV